MSVLLEYLGYGPGNYSTGLPQVQVTSLSEQEEYLAQGQERDCGIVVYTGMNSDGDFFIGNKKINSATGTETNFDIPVPTITGLEPSELSVIFDEVTVKQRIFVEGGNNNNILSQFNGPVNFSQNVKLKGTTTTVEGTLQLEQDVFDGIRLLTLPIDFGLDGVIDTINDSAGASTGNYPPGSFSAGFAVHDRGLHDRSSSAMPG